MRAVPLRLVSLATCVALLQGCYTTTTLTHWSPPPQLCCARKVIITTHGRDWQFDQEFEPPVIAMVDGTLLVVTSGNRPPFRVQLSMVSGVQTSEPDYAADAAWGLLAVLVVAGGILVGGAAYASTHSDLRSAAP
jgi:hypothetical protein